MPEFGPRFDAQFAIHPREAGLDGLIDVKWAFNAKPDMMLASPGCVVFVEAKLESGEGAARRSALK